MKQMAFARIGGWVLGGALLAPMAAPVAAADLDRLGILGQGQFRLLSEDLAAALSYKPVIPAEPLGLTGFDIGVEVSVTDLRSAEALEQATAEDAPAMLPVARLHLHKGLPFGIDAALSYSAVPGSNIELWGGALRYAVLEGSAAMPALGVRASYTRLSGVDQLDFDTFGADVSLSKGFLFLTPYVGVGQVWATGTPRQVPGLAEESFSVTKVFAGVNVAIGLLSIAGEIDRTGEVWSYTGKASLRF